MALTGRLLADFSSFQTAVAQAEVKLRSFESGAGKVESALSRMTDSFSGRKIIQDATLMSEAVERVGGAGKLTEQELRRVGATASEAAAKLRAMGQDVPPGIQKIVDQTKHLNTTQTAMIGTLKSLAGAFGIAFSAQALVGFVSKTLSAASAVKDMSDKLGVSTQAAQEFGFAAEQTGAEIGDVERAIFEMNKGLATGDKSTVKALSDVGLKFEDIRQLAPEDAFKAIAGAIQQIANPMEQSRLAMELFGKSGKELLPAIKEGFVKIGEEAPKMSDATIKALERAQDAWDKLGRAVTTVSGEIIAVGIELPSILSDISKDGASFVAFLKDVAVEGIGAAIAMQHFKRSLGDIKLPSEGTRDPRLSLVPSREDTANLDAARRAQEKYNEALLAFRWEEASTGYRRIAEEQKKAADVAAAALTHQVAMSDMFLKNGQDIMAYEKGVGLLTKGWQGYLQLAPGITKNLTDNGKALQQSGIGSFFKDGLAGLFSDKKGNPATGIASGLKNMLGGIGTGIFNELGSMITGGVSALVGKGIDLIGKGFAKLFGRGEKGKVDDMRQAWIDSIGGWEELNKAAQRAGLTLDKVLNAKKVKDYEAAVADLQRRLDLQKTAWDKVNAAVEKYGFTIEELGPAMQKQKLSETALQLYEDFLLLTGAGIDVETVLKKMADKINAFTQMAVKMGIAVDLSMKPIIQKMIEMGLLVDENGNLITDLEDSGITFSASITDAFLAVSDSLREMIDLLRTFLGLTREVPGNLPGMPGMPGGVPGGHDPTIPDVQLPDAMRLLTAGRLGNARQGATSDVSGLRSELQGLRADLIRQQRLLPKQLRDAMLLAAA